MLVTALFTAVLAARSALAQSFTINSPAALIECQPAALSWTGGGSPYILAVIPGGQPSAAALLTLQSSTTSNSYTWNVNLAAGTSVTIKLTDKDGNIAYSSPITIQAGSDKSCFNASATSAAGAAGVTGASSASASGVSGSASSVARSSASAVSSSASGVAAGVGASASSVSSAAASSISSISSSVRPSSTSSMSGAASTAVSSAAAATSSRSAGDKLAVPGLVLAAAGGLLALF